VLLLVNLDSGSGAAIEGQRRIARREGHRLRPLTLKGQATRSFDNVKWASCRARARRLHGSAAKPAIAGLNGSPTDNNATLFKQGYDSVLKPLYSSGKATRSPISPCPTGTTRRR
jgi:D-xylose transport system substrate-binding protein